MTRHSIAGSLLAGLVLIAMPVAAVLAAADGLTASRYALIADGRELGSFTELESVTSTVQIPTSGQGAVVKGGSIVLRRHMTASRDLWAWHEQVIQGDPAAARKTDLVMYANDGTAIARYRLEHAWPSKLEIGALKAGASEVLMETVNMVCEHVERVAP